MKYLIILTFLLYFQALQAQQEFVPKTTFQVELALPNAIINKPFREIMQGLGSLSLYGQYSFPFHFHVGGGVKYSLFLVNEFSVPSPVYGNLQSGTVFMKVGYDQFHTERFATDIGVKVGYSEHFFTTDANKLNGTNPLRINSPTVEGTVGLVLSTDERNSYRLVLGYGVHGFGFKPEHIGLLSNEGYEQKEFKRLSQYFILGFGYTLYFNGRKNDD